MDYDATKQNYESAHDWHAKKSASHSWAREINEFLALTDPSPQRVLDAGCGDGRDVREFRGQGIEADGLDYSKPAIEGLKKQFPEGNFYEADLRETGIPSDTYDGVWSCAAILNTAKKDIPTVLSEFNRVLKKGGALFISVKEGEGERMVPDKAGERFFSFFKEAEIKSFLENAGFKVDHSEILPGTNFPGSEVQTPPGWLCVYAIKL